MKINLAPSSKLSKLLLAISMLFILLFSVSSCKKETKITPQPETPKTELTGKIDGKDMVIKESAIASTYYSTNGDNVKALETTATLDASGNKLGFFIDDLKNGIVALAKKSGTSANPGSRTIKINDTTPGGVQSYVYYYNGGNTYYAYSGSIEITITETTITVKWNISFKDATGREFGSSGSFSINFATVVTKAKTEIKDPTPVANKPTIENIAPTEGRAGDTIALTGVNYSAAALTDNVVKINGIDATVLSATATKITAKVPQGSTGAVSLKVKNSELTNGPTFSYIQTATVTAIAPTSGKVGDTITVIGTNFSTNAAQNIVKFSGPQGLLVGATVVSSTATQLRVIVPQSAATGTLSLNIKGGATLISPVFTITVPPSNTGNWEDMGFNASSLQETAITATNGTSFMFTGGDGPNYLYYSANGTQYTNIYNNLPFELGRLSLHALKAEGNYYYIATSKGVAKTFDGVTWKKLTPDPLSVDRSFTSIEAKGNNVTLLSGGELFQSADAGETWTKTVAPTGSSLEKITADYNGKYYFAINGSANTLSSSVPKKIYISANGGKTWAPSAGTTGLYFHESGKKEFFEISGTTIYCLFSAETTRASISDQRLYKSTTRGDSWTKVSDDNVMFVKSFGDYVVYSDNSSISVSLDAGNTFKKYALPTGYFAGSATRAGGYLYIIAYNRTAPLNQRIFRQKI